MKTPAWATLSRNRPRQKDEGAPQAVLDYLLPHEYNCVTIRKHPGVFFGHCLVVSCWCVAACLVTAFTDSGALVLGIVWGMFVFFLAWLAVRVVAWRESYFVATETRLIFISGLTTKKVVSVPLREIGTLERRRSSLGRLLGYGEFVAEPATPGYSIPRMNYMPYLEQMLAEVQGLRYPDDRED